MLNAQFSILKLGILTKDIARVDSGLKIQELKNQKPKLKSQKRYPAKHSILNFYF
jgi:hypothetical protein